MNTISIKSKLKDFNLENKTVFLRADLNVTIIKNPDGSRKIFSDYKIQAIRPTIDLILSKKGRIVLATHMGRPKKQEPEYSTQIISEYLAQLGYKIGFENFKNSLDKNIISKKLESVDIVLLENLRFWPEETSNTIDSKEFAKKLYNLAEFYVNDAFGALHRENSSVTQLAQIYPENRKTIGLLVEKELRELTKLKDNPARPLTLILGGGKVKDKLVLIESLIEKIDTVILCPALVFTILRSQGFEVGSSLVEPNLLDYSKKLLNIAKNKNLKLVFPEDYLVGTGTVNKFEKLQYKNISSFNSSDFGISIGPKSVDIFKDLINNSKTIFFNCAMGFFDKPETLESTQKLLNIIGQSKTYSIVGGGDSVAAVQYFGLEKNIDFLSTGGGATLEFLAGKDLPGLKYL